MAFTCLIQLCAAQLTSNQGHIWLKSGIGYSTSSNYSLYGASGEYLITPHIGLNYNLDFLARKDSIQQYHSSAGSIAGVPIILFSLLLDASDGISSDFDLGSLGTFAGIAMLVAPDGISYHFPIRYHYDVAPYANLLGLDILRNRYEPSTKIKWATSYGVKGSYWMENGWTFNAFLESRKTASLPWQFGVGVGIGYSFAPRTIKTVTEQE